AQRCAYASLFSDAQLGVEQLIEETVGRGRFLDGSRDALAELFGRMHQAQPLEPIPSDVEVDAGFGSAHRAASAKAAYRSSGRWSGTKAASSARRCPIRPSGTGGRTSAVACPS